MSRSQQRKSTHAREKAVETTVRSDGEKRLLWSLLVVWLALVVIWLTWTPLQRGEGPNPIVLFPSTSPLELVGNAMLLMPLAIVIALGLVRRPILAATAAAFALSTCVEIGQVFLVGRVVSLTDVLLNTIGGLAAAWVAVRLAPLLGRRRIIAVVGGLVFAGIAGFALVGGGIYGSLLRIDDWDPGFEVVLGDEADGSRPFQGRVIDGRICAGKGMGKSALAKVPRRIYGAGSLKLPSVHR